MKASTDKGSQKLVRAQSFLPAQKRSSQLKHRPPQSGAEACGGDWSRVEFGLTPLCYVKNYWTRIGHNVRRNHSA